MRMVTLFIIMIILSIVSVSAFKQELMLREEQVLITQMDDLLPCELGYNDTNVWCNLDYSKNALLLQQATTKYNSGIPVWQKESTMKCEAVKDWGKEQLTKEGVLQTCNSEGYDLTKSEKYAVSTKNKIILPLLVGEYHIGTESTVIEVTNTTSALTHNISSNYGFMLTANDTNLIKYLPFDIDRNDTNVTRDVSLKNGSANQTITWSGNMILNTSACFRGNCWSQDATDANQGTIQWNDAGNEELRLNNSGFTFIFRLYLYSNLTGTQTIYAKTNQINIQYLQGSNAVKATLMNNASFIALSPVGFLPSTQYCIAVRYNTSHLQVFKDGQNSTDLYGNFTSGTSAQHIGRDGTSNYMNATIDEFMIFNVPKTNQEIVDICNEVYNIFYSQGKATLAVNNFSAVSFEEGNEYNVTVNGNVSSGTTLNISLRQHNATSSIYTDLVGWWDFNTFYDKSKYISENTGCWENPNCMNVSMMYVPTPNVTVDLNSRFERGISNLGYLAGNMPSPHGLVEVTSGQFNRSFLQMFTNWTMCVIANNSAVRTGSYFRSGNSNGITVRTNNINSSHHDVLGEIYNSTGNLQTIGNNNKIFRNDIWEMVCLVKNYTNISVVVYNDDYSNGYFDSRPITPYISHLVSRFGICNSGLQFAGINGTCDEFFIWNESKTNDTLIQLWQNKSHWLNYSAPCDVSINTTGCLFNRTSNFTQVQAEIFTTNMSRSPVVYSMFVSLQNVSGGAPPGNPCALSCNSVVSSPLDCAGNNIQLSGTGVLDIKAAITNYASPIQIPQDCKIECHEACI